MRTSLRKLLTETRLYLGEGGPVDRSSQGLLEGLTPAAEVLIAALRSPPYNSYFEKITVRGAKATIKAPKLNSQLDKLEITGLDKDTATFRIYLKNGMSGWDWDEWRRPPKFHSNPGYNSIFLTRLPDPTAKPDAFADSVRSVYSTLSGQIKQSGWVVTPSKDKPGKINAETYADWQASEKAKQDAQDKAAKDAAQAAAEKLNTQAAAPQERSLDDVTRRLKSMRLGSAGRVIRVERDSDTEWTVEPLERQRLDHYQGSGYRDRDDGDDDGDDDGYDDEGWDEEGWEDDYAGPTRAAAQKWLDAEFGAGVFDVDVGEKGHVHLNLTPVGAKLFKVKGR